MYNKLHGQFDPPADHGLQATSFSQPLLHAGNGMPCFGRYRSQSAFRRRHVSSVAQA